MAGGDLKTEAQVAWHRYDLCCRFGGTKSEREFAFGLALRAELALAARDYARVPKRQREAVARALSGA